MNHERRGQPCQCEACVVAGVSHRPLISVAPGEWLHGRDLARWYEARRKFNEALDWLKRQRRDSEAERRTA